MRYRIGEFARLSGVSVKTLRFYDQIGLLEPAAVDPRTQYRFYVPRQLRDVAAIVALKALGASLHDIRRATAGCQQERHKLLTELRARAELSMDAARRSLTWIDDALNETETDREVAVVLKHRPAVRVASVRAQARSYAEIGELELTLQRAVMPAFIGDVRGVLWHRCAASGAIEGEPFVEIGPRVRPCGDYAVKELPSCTMAIAYCEPTDRDAERVYDAMSRWLHLHRFQLAGPKREIYMGQILEVQFPVGG